MKHGARTSVHRKQGVYSSWYKTSSACVRTTDVTVVFPLGVWGAMGCSGGGMRIVVFALVYSFCNRVGRREDALLLSVIDDPIYSNQMMRL